MRRWKYESLLNIPRKDEQIHLPSIRHALQLAIEHSQRPNELISSCPRDDEMPAFFSQERVVFYLTNSPDPFVYWNIEYTTWTMTMDIHRRTLAVCLQDGSEVSRIRRTLEIGGLPRFLSWQTQSRVETEENSVSSELDNHTVCSFFTRFEDDDADDFVVGSDAKSNEVGHEWDLTKSVDGIVVWMIDKEFERLSQ